MKYVAGIREYSFLLLGFSGRCCSWLSKWWSTHPVLPGAKFTIIWDFVVVLVTITIGWVYSYQVSPTGILPCSMRICCHNIIEDWFLLQALNFCELVKALVQITYGTYVYELGLPIC